MLLTLIVPLVLSACGEQPVVVQTVVVEQTRVVKEAGEERTVVETVIVEKEVTPAPPTEVPAPATPEPKESNTVVIAMQQEPDTLHTAISSMSASTYVMAAVLLGCMGQNDKVEWVNLGCDGDIPPWKTAAPSSWAKAPTGTWRSRTRSNRVGVGPTAHP